MRIRYLIQALYFSTGVAPYSCSRTRDARRTARHLLGDNFAKHEAAAQEVETTTRA